MIKSEPLLDLVREGHHAHAKTMNSQRKREFKLNKDPNAVGIAPVSLLLSVELAGREKIER
jgi:hypothetical protein